jgi:hypothetical protein
MLHLCYAQLSYASMLGIYLLFSQSLSLRHVYGIFNCILSLMCIYSHNQPFNKMLHNMGKPFSSSPIKFCWIFNVIKCNFCCLTLSIPTSNFVAETPVDLYLKYLSLYYYIWFCFGGNNIIVRINTIRKCFDPLITYLSLFLQLWYAFLQHHYSIRLL